MKLLFPSNNYIFLTQNVLKFIEQKLNFTFTVYYQKSIKQTTYSVTSLVPKNHVITQTTRFVHQVYQL